MAPRNVMGVDPSTLNYATDLGMRKEGGGGERGREGEREREQEGGERGEEKILILI